MKSSLRVTVLGGGIIGLTSALTLLRDGFTKLTLIAKDFEEDTTTALSGDKERMELTMSTLLKDVEEQESGAVCIRHGFVYFPTKKVNEPWFSNILPMFGWVSDANLPTHLGAKSGIEIATPFIHPLKYMKYLLGEIERAGGKIVKREVSHINELFPSSDVIINCTGLGSRNLGGVNDQSIYPVRGQTVLVNTHSSSLPRPHIDFRSFRETGNPWSILPREDGVYILNGTYMQNDFSTIPDANIARQIQEKCTNLWPVLLNGAEIISHQVGLRPYREGGVRMELCEIEGKTIVHNYGHGGEGVIMSWGSAEQVKRLLAEKYPQSRSKL